MAWTIGKTWNPTYVKNVIRELRRFGSDTTLIECKRAGNGAYDDVYESIAAFANMPEGGVLLLGVDEVANFRISGVSNSRKMESEIVDKVRQAIKPAPQLNFFHISVEGRTVLVIEVIALAPHHKPATFRQKAYLRQSDGDYIMNDNDKHMILVEGLHERQRVHYDTEVIVGTDKAELDSSFLSTYLKNARTSNARLAQITNDDQLLQIAGVTDREGQLRLGGLYALGFLPSAHFPSLAATAAVRVQRDDSGVRNRNLQDFEGPIPVLLERTMEWVRQNISQERAYGADGHMEIRPEFPMPAIRELLANAFVHRDLSPDSIDAGKRVEIRVFHDRVMIQSPGGLRGLSKSQLESAELSKAAVNQRVYEIAKNLETTDGEPIIEGEGGGIPEVFYAMRRAGKPDPRFFDNGVTFTVNLLRANRFDDDEMAWLSSLGVSLGWMQNEILIGLKRGERWSRVRASKEFRMAKTHEVTNAIEGLLQSGILEEVEDVLVLKQSQPNVGSDRAFDELGPNTGAIYAVVSAVGSTVADIVAASGLTDNQVRYGLKQLLDAGAITMIGGRGIRNTLYTRSG